MPSPKSVQNVGTQSSNLQLMPWEEIKHPGSYLYISSGTLVRIPQEALAPGHSPLISITANDETRVALLSDNPSTPIRYSTENPEARIHSTESMS